MARDGILAGPICTQRLLNEQPQRRQWRVEPFAERTDFGIEKGLESLGRNGFRQVSGRVVSDLLFESRNAFMKAFFWYRYTWLILSCLTLTLDTNILPSRGSQPLSFPCFRRQKSLKVVP